MVCQDCQEITDHVDSQDLTDQLEHQELMESLDIKDTKVCKVTMDQKENKERLVPQEPLENQVVPVMVDLRVSKDLEVPQDLQDLQEELVDPVQWDQLEHVDLREHVVKLVCKARVVPLVSKDKTELQDDQERLVHKVNGENLDPLVFLVLVENPDVRDQEDLTVPKDSKEPWEVQETPGQLDNLVHKDLQDTKDWLVKWEKKEAQEAQEVLEELVQEDERVMLVPQDLEVHLVVPDPSEKMVSKEALDQLDLLDSEEKKERLDLQELLVFSE